MWGTVAALALKFLPGAIAALENIFKRGDEKLGPVRMDTLVDVVKLICEQLKKNKFITDVPSEEMIKGWIEMVFQPMKAEGKLALPMLPAAPSTVTPGTLDMVPSEGVWVLRGTATKV